MLAFRNESPPSWVCSMSRIVKRSTSQAVKSDPSGRSRHDSPHPQFVPPPLSQAVEKPSCRSSARSNQATHALPISYPPELAVSRGFVLRGQKS
jgi:hypothetical protein